MIELSISGIKCDNKKCDFKDDSVKFEDYGKWLNKPCPKCGENLLTKEDYNACKRMMFISNAMSSIFNKNKDKDNGDKLRASIELDGKGNASIENIERIEK